MSSTLILPTKPRAQSRPCKVIVTERTDTLGSLKGQSEIIDSFASPWEAINFLQLHWMEDGGQQFFEVFLGEYLYAILYRPDPERDPELCVTVMADGLTARHRCHYVKDSEGRHVGALVRRLR